MVTAQLTPVAVGIQNVLIATDFSRYSSAALSFGLQVAKAYQGQAYVVSVLPTSEFLLAGPEAYVAAKDAVFRDLVELKSELKRTHSYDEGTDYHLFLLEGDVAQAILDFARQKGIDLIVVGTHGRGGLGKALMGSVAERVFRASPVPVVTLGPHFCSVRREDSLRNILVAADFSPASERALRYAAALAQERNAKLTLLHVLSKVTVDGAVDRPRLMQSVKTRLTELLGREAASVECRLRVETGRVVPTVLKATEETDADLLVIGVRPSGGVLDRLMFPHAYELICESPCPVLTLRETAPQN
jgi:nucleotide-binding universal stress UspA family protein